MHCTITLCVFLRIHGWKFFFYYLHNLLLFSKNIFFLLLIQYFYSSLYYYDFSFSALVCPPQCYFGQEYLLKKKNENVIPDWEIFVFFCSVFIFQSSQFRLSVDILLLSCECVVSSSHKFYSIRIFFCCVLVSKKSKCYSFLSSAFWQTEFSIYWVTHRKIEFYFQNKNITTDARASLSFIIKQIHKIEWKQKVFLVKIYFFHANI